jgi:hypothetical protein
MSEDWKKKNGLDNRIVEVRAGVEPWQKAKWRDE